MPSVLYLGIVLGANSCISMYIAPNGLSFAQVFFQEDGLKPSGT